MSEPKEITIRIKGEDELVIKKKFLVYEDTYAHSADEIIKSCIDATKGDYKGSIENIKITIVLEV